MRGLKAIRHATLCAGVLGFAAATAEEMDVQATWQPQEIRYSYSGFTTAYDCDAAETKLEHILRALGAHPNTQVRASGCLISRPSKNFFITITTATPVAVAVSGSREAAKDSHRAAQRLQAKDGDFEQPFAAHWKAVDLAKERKLDLRPGDCELMEGLRDQVLPKIGVKIVEERISCTPNQLSIQTPTLKVDALVPGSAADDGK